MKRLLASALLILLASGCSVTDDTDQQSSDTRGLSLSDLDSTSISKIEGNDGHNRLAGQSRLDRALGLAEVVKAVQGKRYCSADRTFYRGRGETDSFWAIQCHDGTAYQVLIKKDGSGGVMECDILDRIDPSNSCWSPLPKR